MTPRRLIALLALLMLLAACAPAAAPTPTLAPLGRTYTSPDKTVSIQYPPSWVLKGESTNLVIGSSQAAVDALTPGAGQFQMRIVIGPASAIPGLTIEATPRQVIEYFINALRANVPFDVTPPAYGGVQEVTIRGRSAARSDVTAPDGQGVVVALNLGWDVYAVVSAATGPGDLARFEPTFIAILESLTYAPLVTPTPAR